MPKVGFLVTSYNAPGQLLRLARCLTAVFDAPPIVCNHDFDQCQFDTSAFPNNFTFVRPHVPMAWGSIKCVDASLRALRILYDKQAPDWFFLLSGSDYPVSPLNSTVQRLEGGGFDAYMDHRPIRQQFIAPGHTGDIGFKSKRFVALAYGRYRPMFLPVRWPFSPDGRRRLKFDFPLVDRLNPVLRLGMEIYAGKYWFVANRRCAERLLSHTSRVKLLRKYFSGRHIPEEAFYQTALCNYDDIAVSTDSLRYEYWTSDNPNPDWLEIDHVPAIRTSGALIARKFRENAPVLDRIECELLGLPRPSATQFSN